MIKKSVVRMSKYGLKLINFSACAFRYSVLIAVLFQIEWPRVLRKKWI